MERRAWTTEEDDLLISLYGKVPAKDIHQHVPDRTPASVAGRLSKLGVRTPKEPDWTPADIETLRQQYGRVSRKKLAKLLGRTEEAVHIKATRMKLGARKRRLTPRTIGGLLNICAKQVKRWIEKGWLKAEVLYKGPRSIHAVMQDDLIECLKAHPEAWDARRCPDLHLKLGLKAKRSWGSATDRPIWLKDKLADDIRKGRKGKRWTREEDARLAQFLRKGLTYEKIAAQLGREPAGVEHRIHRLGKRLWETTRRKSA